MKTQEKGKAFAHIMPVRVRELKGNLDSQGVPRACAMLGVDSHFSGNADGGVLLVRKGVRMMGHAVAHRCSLYPEEKLVLAVCASGSFCLRSLSPPAGALGQQHLCSSCLSHLL